MLSMFEHRSKPLLPIGAFALRVAKCLLGAAILVLVSLGVGAAGYHLAEGMPWLDATLNAAMILTGMGPAAELKTTGGKLFATAYALFSGVIFLTVAALVLAPIAHRLLHHFHLELEEEDRDCPPPGRRGV